MLRKQLTRNQILAHYSEHSSLSRRCGPVEKLFSSFPAEDLSGGSMSALSAPAMERKKPGVACSKAKVEKPSADQPNTFTQELQMERVNKIFGMLRQGKVVQLRDLAMELNLSTSHLQHVFKQY